MMPTWCPAWLSLRHWQHWASGQAKQVPAAMSQPSGNAGLHQPLLSPHPGAQWAHAGSVTHLVLGRLVPEGVSGFSTVDEDQLLKPMAPGSPRSPEALSRCFRQRFLDGWGSSCQIRK